MRVLITGSRDYDDYERMLRILSSFERGTIIIHGNARGADTLAQRAADILGFETEIYPADWDTYGKAAGAIRNQQMVDAGAELCLAFPLEGSKGTIDCMERAERAGIIVILGDEMVLL